MKPKLDIISVGPDFREWPYALWGTRDKEVWAQQHATPADPVTVPLNTYALPGFGLYGNTSKRPQISALADEVLAAAGVRKRPRREQQKRAVSTSQPVKRGPRVLGL